MEGQNQNDIWHWIATVVVGGLLSLVTLLGSMLANTFNRRLVTVEKSTSEIGSDIAGIRAEMKALHELVLRREIQSHEGYQRLASVETVIRGFTDRFDRMEEKLDKLIDRQTPLKG